MNMHVVIICFTVFIVMLISIFRKGSDLFSPARLFILVWSLALGLASLKFSRYQIDWTDYSWTMYVISLGSLLLGIFIIWVINIGNSTSDVKSIRDIIKKNTINSNLLFRYTIFLFIAYLISYLVSALVIGFIPLFTKYPGLARNDWGIFGFGLFVQSFPAIIFLAVLYFIFAKGQYGKKMLMFLVVLISFITYSFLLQRYYIVFALILIVVAIYYTTNLFKAKNVLLISFVLIAIFFGMSFIRLTGTIVNYLYYLSDMRYSVKYAIFTEPYMYIVMNLENFANAVNKIDKFTYGLFTFDFVFALSGLKHTLFKYLSLVEFPFMITNNYNTYTMFFIYYWDFGVLGLGLIPFVLGMIFSNSYYRMKRFPNIHNISVYSIFAFVILFSFFIPIISFLHFAFNFFVIYTVTGLINKDN